MVLAYGPLVNVGWPGVIALLLVVLYAIYKIVRLYRIASRNASIPANRETVIDSIVVAIVLFLIYLDRLLQGNPPNLLVVAFLLLGGAIIVAGLHYAYRHGHLDMMDFDRWSRTPER